MITLNELTKYAQEFLKESYDMDLTVPIKINGRLRTTYGRFRYYDYEGNWTPLNVELNKYFVENNTKESVLSVLRHELIHYALFMRKEPFSDGHPHFESEIRKHDAISQSNVEEYKINNKPKKVIFYECVKCNHEYKRTRALKYNGIYHKCSCGGSLINKGKNC